LDKDFNIWLAGFWEGEGCISSCRKMQYIRIDIAQSITKGRDVETMMEKLKNTYGGNIYKNIIPNFKPQLRWRLGKRKKVMNFIRTILPYCQFRKNELINALEIMEEAGDIKTVYVDKKEAIKMRKNNYTYKEIANTLKVSPTTVWRRCNLNQPSISI
jgi:hypothetical protein